MAKENNQTKSSTNDAKIDAIKQLIFGENIQQYDEEFKEIKDNILLAQKQMNEHLENTKAELKNLINTVQNEQNQKLSELQAKMEDEVASLKSTKLDRQLLGDLLQEIGGKIKE